NWNQFAANDMSIGHCPTKQSEYNCQVGAIVALCCTKFQLLGNGSHDSTHQHQKIGYSQCVWQIRMLLLLLLIPRSFLFSYPRKLITYYMSAFTVIVATVHLCPI